MRSIIVLILSILLNIVCASQDIIFENPLSINKSGDNPNSSAILDIDSDSKGILIPRMDSNAYKAILNPTNGLMVYDETNNCFAYYNGALWKKVNSINSEISDKNMDTRITVERTSNEDTITAYIEGDWQLKLSKNSFGDLSIQTPGNVGNTFFGKGVGLFNQGYGNSVGGANTFIGVEAGAGNIQGSESTMVGYRCGISHDSGRYNTFYGAYSGYKVEEGNYNLLLGSGAGYNIKSAFRNVMIGTNAGRNRKSSIENTFLGYAAGYPLISGVETSGSIMIGYEAGRKEVEGDKLYIENSDSSTPLIYGDFEKDSLHFNAVTGSKSIHLTDTTSHPKLGTLYNKSAPIAYAVIDQDGAILTQFGVAISNRIGIGHYKITIQNPTSTPPIVLSNPYGTNATELFSTSYITTADDEIIVYIHDNNGDRIDRQFSLLVMGW